MHYIEYKNTHILLIITYKITIFLITALNKLSQT